MASLVRYSTDKGVATLTLDDAPLNAFTYEMWKELDDRILEARFDNDVHVIVLTGHGEEYFSPGTNIHMLREADDAFKANLYLYASEALERLERTPKLTIAALNGHCVAEGLELALACDLRVVRDGAARLGFPQVDLGLLPGVGGAGRLAKIVSPSVAIDLLLSGEILGVEDAAGIGLVHEIVMGETFEEFSAEVRRYAHSFCPPAKPAGSIARIKRLVRAACSPEQATALLERELFAAVAGSADAREGLTAFAQKRAPSFSTR